MAKKLPKFEVYVNGWKEADVQATDQEDAVRVFWEYHATQEHKDLREKDQAKLIIEPVK